MDKRPLDLRRTRRATVLSVLPYLLLGYLILLAVVAVVAGWLG